MKSRLFFSLLLLSGLLCLSQKVNAAVYDYDLSIGSSDIYFSTQTLIAGQTVRIYAKVHNLGNKDITGQVSFFRGVNLIGNSMPVSVLPGSSDDVFVDYVVPTDSFNIQAKIQVTDPADQNPGNNETQTTLIVPDIDTDGDGIVNRLDDNDDNDNLKDSEENGTCTDPLKADTDGDGAVDGVDEFPCNAQETVDTDHDGLGNNADPDDDNDGWSDAQEQAHGTDPLRKDTDGDGVNDPQDAYPLDASKSSQAAVQDRNIFQPPINANQNANQSPVNQPIVQNQNVNQSINNLDELNQELNNLTNSSETEKKIAEQPLEQIGEVMEQVSGQTKSFFRLGNWLMWLLFLIIMVVVAIAYVLVKNRVGQAALEVVNQEPVQVPPLPEARHWDKTKVKVNGPKIIDLKKMMKGKKNEE